MNDYWKSSDYNSPDDPYQKRAKQLDFQSSYNPYEQSSGTRYDYGYKEPKYEQTWSQKNPMMAGGIGAGLGAISSIFDVVKQNRQIDAFNKNVSSQRKALGQAKQESLGMLSNLRADRNMTANDIKNKYLMADKDTASQIGQTFFASNQQSDQNILGLTRDISNITTEMGKLTKMKKPGFFEVAGGMLTSAGQGFLGGLG
jgi:hypothetical protein